MKKRFWVFIVFFIGLVLVFNSCEKEEKNNDETKCEHGADCTMSCCADNGTTARLAMKEDGYTEIEVVPIEKIDCYFEQWDKTIMTPVSGLFDYHNQNDTWVASIDFGDGTCDQWVTKTWDVDIFPDYPEGTEEFSLFDY